VCKTNTRHTPEQRVFQVWDGEGCLQEIRVETIEEGFQGIINHLENERDLNKELCKFLRELLNSGNILDFIDSLCQIEVAFRVVLEKTLNECLEHPPDLPRLKKL
jgi:hypothetical protein